MKPHTLGFFPPMSPKRVCPHHGHGPFLGITRPGEAPAPAGAHTRIIFSQSPVRLEMGGVRHLLAGLCSCYCVLAEHPSWFCLLYQGAQCPGCPDVISRESSVIPVSPVPSASELTVGMSNKARSSPQDLTPSIIQAPGYPHVIGYTD